MPHGCFLNYGLATYVSQWNVYPRVKLHKSSFLHLGFGTLLFNRSLLSPRKRGGFLDNFGYFIHHPTHIANVRSFHWFDHRSNVSRRLPVISGLRP